MNNTKKVYDILIIGGGASGAALLYTLAKYTNISKITLVEKYNDFGKVNSNAINNSQTLHVGDIETNYSFEKVKAVKPAAMMVAKYIEGLPENERDIILKRVQKMILAVGDSEVSELRNRHEQIKELFPTLQILEGNEIAKVEPEVMRNRNKNESTLALFNTEGYAVNFGELARSFIKTTKTFTDKTIDIFLHCPVISIKKNKDLYNVRTKNGILKARFVIVDTDAYSLGFAKSLGYGKEFSLIPVAGSFYFTKQLLNGKVYTMQDSRMPFAAVHGDPDLTKDNVTRFGPTARFFPVLESRNLSSSKDFFTSSGLHKPYTWISFLRILLEPVRFIYLLKNLFYEIPFIGKYLFLPQIRKIVPSIKGSELQKAKGYGGMRLQRVDTNTHELLLGEGKIIGDNIIFNMTPSPGASVCLHNAVVDVEYIIKTFNGEFIFNKNELEKDLLT